MEWGTTTIYVRDEWVLLNDRELCVTGDVCVTGKVEQETGGEPDEVFDVFTAEDFEIEALNVYDEDNKDVTDTLTKEEDSFFEKYLLKKAELAIDDNRYHLTDWGKYTDGGPDYDHD